MPIANLESMDMYYEIHGSGLPLVLISGFGADHMVWDSVKTLLAASFQVIVLDNRGVGQSSVPDGPYSIEQMANDVVQLCAYLNIESAYFCGNSMGGCIVQTLAYQHPQLVKKAIVSNSALQVITPFIYFVRARYRMMQQDIDKTIIIKALLGFLFSYHYLSTPGIVDGLIELALSNPYPITLKGYAAQMVATGSFDAREFAHHIKLPVLVIGAEEDIIFLPAQTRALIETIPNAVSYSFKQAGHLPHIEHPEEFVAVVNNFLEIS